MSPMQVSQAFVSELKRRWRDAEAKIEVLLPLVAEERVLEQTVAFYSDAPASTDDQVRTAVESRLEDLRAQTNELLPFVDEANHLGRLVWLYEEQNRPLAQEDVEQRRRSRRLLVERRLEMRERQSRDMEERLVGLERERRMMVARAAEQDPSRPDRIRRDMQNSLAEIDRRIAETRDRLARRLPARPASINETRASSDSRRLDAVMSANVAALVSGDPDRAAQIAAAAREYLIERRVKELPFAELYRGLETIAAQTPSRSERARVERFRYDLKRKAEQFGLAYDRSGIVRLLPADGDGERSDAAPA